MNQDCEILSKLRGSEILCELGSSASSINRSWNSRGSEMGIKKAFEHYCHIVLQKLVMIISALSNARRFTNLLSYHITAWGSSRSLLQAFDLSQLIRGVEVLQTLFDSLCHCLLPLSNPHSWVEILLVRLVVALRVSDRLHQVVLLLKNVISNTGQVRVLQIRVQVDLDNTVSNSVSVFILARARTAMEDQEYWLVFFCAVLLLDVCLMFAKEFWMEFDVTRLVDTMDVAKASSDAEVGGDLGEGGPDVVDVFRLGVERVVVDIFVVNTVLFATGNANFLRSRISKESVGIGPGIDRTISSHCFIGAARFKYLAVVSIFQSTASSDKSIMCDENRGSPCSLKYFSSASIMPSSHGRSFLAQ